MVRFSQHLIVSVLFSCCFARVAGADVQNFTDAQRPQWFDAVAELGEYSTITFSDLSAGTVLGTQFQDEFGVTFTDGDDRVHFCPFCYPNDEFGVDGNLTTTIVFDEPQNWFAVDNPGILQIRVFNQGQLLHTGPPSAFFAGVISDQPFDRVELFDPGDSNVNMDDIYLGAIPEPGTFLLVAAGFLCGVGRRRSEHK